jgi:spore maturation protein CgeB
MCSRIEALLSDGDLATRLSAHGRRTIAARHTCAHRVDDLLEVVSQLGQHEVRNHSLAQAAS